MPFTRKLNVVELKWQVFWLLSFRSPSHSLWKNSGNAHRKLILNISMKFTATGIAPELHRTSLLTPRYEETVSGRR